MVTTHLSKRLIRYTTDRANGGQERNGSESPSNVGGGVQLYFKDGTSARCDVLIGADGLHSATRHSLLNEAACDLLVSGDAAGADALRAKADPLWSGTFAYRGVVSKEKLEQVNAMHRSLNTPQLVSLTFIVVPLGIVSGLIFTYLQQFMGKNKVRFPAPRPWTFLRPYF